MLLQVLAFIQACRCINALRLPPGQKNEELERQVLFLIPRELWASGFDARKPSDLLETDGANQWEWMPETVDVFRAFYNRIMLPEHCDVPYTVAQKTSWGMTSRIRDLENIIFYGLIHERLILHDGSRDCQWPDPMMLCIFEPFSNCQGLVTINETLKPTNPDWVQRNRQSWEWLYDDGTLAKAIKPIWNTLLGAGLRRVGDVQTETPPFVKLGVLRSLLNQVAFKPSSYIEHRTSELENMLKKPHGPMLIIQIRRTDKLNDGASLPDWFSVSKMSIGNTSIGDEHLESLRGIKALINFTQSLVLYKSVYLISDDPTFFESKYISALQNEFTHKPTVLFNPYILQSYSNDQSWMHDRKTLHEQKDEQELAADMNFAIKYGTHIIGCGRSGISQFIAQGLGARIRVEPNTLSLFEDDSKVLRQVLGDAETLKHFRFMARYMSRKPAQKAGADVPQRKPDSLELQKDLKENRNIPMSEIYRSLAMDLVEKM